MKKIAILMACIVIFLAFILAYFFYQKPSNNILDISQTTDGQIIAMLAKNKDGAEYMQKYKDFKIQDKIILTKDAILAGQRGTTFKEVYQGLALENNRYLKVDLMNPAANRGLVAVLDFKTGQAIKAYGIILLQSATK